MDFETTKQLVFEVLKKNYVGSKLNLQMGTVMHAVYELAKVQSIIQESNVRYLNGAAPLPEDMVEHVLDIMNALLQQGVIRWGLDRSNLNPPYMSVTSYGKEVLTNTEEIPHDPDGYVKFIKSKSPQFDKTVEIYLVESLETFLRGNFLASAVMLGVSSEAIFDILYDTMFGSITSQKIKDDFNKTRDRTINRRIQLVTDTIKITIKPKLPNEIVDDFDSKTGPILNLIRRLRNDAGHPTGIQIERMEMFSNLMLFKVYCETAYQLIEFFKTNII